MNATPFFPERIEMETAPIGAVDLALFAAASGDHNPLHLDADVARAAGFDKPLIHGMLSMACAGRLFTSHFGPAAVKSLDTRFTGVAKLGERLRFVARLVQHNGATATYQVQGQTHAGGEVVTGSAAIALPPAS
ncbi:MAG: MaoC/PaaZ C-terminal domain-containing protein [Rudaea sp.]|uniref:MaoC/PaaZ C-terminal domain-containing protein n=1 Tax=Rudaea sp. TaxID=2136325 RepID=UPI0039E6F039